MHENCENEQQCFQVETACPIRITVHCPDACPFLATVILDRLLKHATTSNFRGESYRLKERRRAGLLNGARSASEQKKGLLSEN